MPKKGAHRAQKIGGKGKSAVVIGVRRFAKISAVEGIALTREMHARAAEFDRKGLSADERRQSIIRVHRKA